MKRSELRRDPVKIAAWLRKPRKPITRTALRRGPGRKAQRERPALDRFRETLRARNDGYCEGPNGATIVVDGQRRYVDVPHANVWTTPGTIGRHPGCDPHHLFPEDRDRGVHDPARGLWLCRPCHDWIDAHPAWAHQLGLLRPDDG